MIEITKEEIANFVKKTDFSGYQGLRLPHGITIPGKDLSNVASIIFPDTLQGKSVLDVGCYYGFFSHEARRRGAGPVVGLEMDKGRFDIAKKISTFMANGVEINHGGLEEMEIGDTYDLVLFLGVMHHVTDPVKIMTKLAGLCKGYVIVEFPTPAHRIDRYHPGNTFDALLFRLREYARSFLINTVGKNWPLILVGEEEYHRVWYFSQKAFFNLFVIHNKLFSDIRYLPSPRKKNRVIAFCKI